MIFHIPQASHLYKGINKQSENTQVKVTVIDSKDHLIIAGAHVTAAT